MHESQVTFKVEASDHIIEENHEEHNHETEDEEEELKKEKYQDELDYLTVLIQQLDKKDKEKQDF